MKHFDRSNGLDTALYKHYLYLLSSWQKPLCNVICMCYSLVRRYEVHTRMLNIIRVGELALYMQVCFKKSMRA